LARNDQFGLCGSGFVARGKRECSRMAKMTYEKRTPDPKSSVGKLAILLVGAVALELVATKGLAGTLPHLVPPPIAGDVKCEDWRNCSKANYAFTQILREQFPLGTHENVLRAVLLRQGFSSLPASITACLPRGHEASIGTMVIECPAWDPNWNPRNFLPAATLRFERHSDLARTNRTLRRG